MTETVRDKISADPEVKRLRDQIQAKQAEVYDVSARVKRLKKEAQRAEARAEHVQTMYELGETGDDEAAEATAEAQEATLAVQSIGTTLPAKEEALKILRDRLQAREAELLEAETERMADVLREKVQASIRATAALIEAQREVSEVSRELQSNGQSPERIVPYGGLWFLPSRGSGFAQYLQRLAKQGFEVTAELPDRSRAIEENGGFKTFASGFVGL